MDRRSFIQLCGGGLALSTLPTASAAAVEQPFGVQPLLPLSSRRYGVHVVINGRGPFLFLIDTATSHSLVTPKVAQALQLRRLPGPEIDIVTALGSVRSSFYEIGEIAFAGVIVEASRAAIVDLPYQIGVDGVLGAEVFTNFLMDLDLFKRTLALHSASTSFRPPGFVPIQGVLNQWGFIVLPAQIERFAVKAILDTGAEATIGNDELRKNKDGVNRLTLNGQERSVIDASKRRSQTTRHTFSRVTLGPATWNSCLIEMMEMRVFAQTGLSDRPAVLFGMDLLRGRRMLFDYANARLWLAR